MTDPVADMLTRIRNGSKALQPEIQFSYSKLKESIGNILQKEGYIVGCSVHGTPRKTLKLKLKFNGRKEIIEGLKRVSRPGLRRYVGATSVPRVLGGLGTVIMSTPRGVMTGVDARKQNLGGEVLCYIW